VFFHAEANFKAKSPNFGALDTGYATPDHLPQPAQDPDEQPAQLPPLLLLVTAPLLLWAKKTESRREVFWLWHWVQLIGLSASRKDLRASNLVLQS
jgi:hypothetical protein